MCSLQFKTVLCWKLYQKINHWNLSNCADEVTHGVSAGEQQELKPEVQFPDGIIFPSLHTRPAAASRAALAKVFPRNPCSSGAATEDGFVWLQASHL